MKDLLIKSEKYLDTRISFTDDITLNETLKISDITGLIANFRDAACHSDSFRRKIGSNVVSFTSIYGKGIGMQINDVIIENKYEDDVVFIMGQDTLYLKRHIERAFDELNVLFKPHIS